MSSFEDALEQEIAELVRALEADPRFVKLRELERVARLYRSGVSMSGVARSAAGVTDRLRKERAGMSLEAYRRFKEATKREAQNSAVAEEASAGPTAAEELANEAFDSVDSGEVARPLATASAEAEGLGPRQRAALTRDAIIQDLQKFLRGRIHPTRTSELFQVVRHLGHEIPGDNPRNNLSAILSRAKDVFVSHGKAGWTLVENEPSREHADAAYVL